jgi:hypothetical protein
LNQVTNSLDYDYHRKVRGYLKPTNLGFENNGVINPAIYQDGIQSIFYIGAVREGNLPLAMQNGRTNYSSRKNGKASYFRFDYEKQGPKT